MGDTARSLEALHFDNLSLRAAPVDPRQNDKTQRQVRGACYSRVEPTPVANPRLVGVSLPALSLLDLDVDQVARQEFVQCMSGNSLLPGMDPAAHCYCGHQFGNFAGQLGDGAAIYLGEVLNAHGERWEVQLKGAGLTPYSRHADGRKVLRSSIREFLASEAMFHLGIPTTRALSVVTSDTRVERDIFYNGNPIMERCSLVCRLAPTFWRFGSFEIFKPTDSSTGRAGPSTGMAKQLEPGMADHIIRTYYPNIWQAYNGDALGAVESKVDMYCDWLRELFRRTAALVAGWMSVGFTHGVLNTDNMSILGLTLDYGPYGFMDMYNPDHVPNHSDDSGRYRYSRQPEMVRWNCEKLCEALAEVLPLEASRPLLDMFDEEYDRCYWRIFRNKLGLLEKEKEEDVALINDLLTTMHDTGADFTATFRALSKFPLPPSGTPTVTTDSPSTAAAAAAATAPDATTSDAAAAAGQPAAATALPPAAAVAAPAAAGSSGRGSAAEGGGAAPAFDDGGVLESLMMQLAGAEEVAEGGGRPTIPMPNLQMLMMLGSRDPTVLQALGVSQQVLQDELERHWRVDALRRVSPQEKAASDRRAWLRWLDRYGTRLAAEARVGADNGKRVAVMNSTNPKFVLRQWVAQYAIAEAEKGNFTAVQQVLEVLQQPYSDKSSAELAAGAPHLPGVDGEVCVVMPPLEGPVPDWGKKLCVSCSS